MKRKSILLSATVILGFLVQLTFAALPRYEIIDLGTLGGYSSWAHAINDAGQVVGHSLTADHQVHAFLWDNAIGMIDLGTIGNLFGSIAWGINNNEQVVGVLSITGGISRAFIWDSATGMVDLGAGAASSINNAGRIAGHFPTVYDPAAHFFRSHACIWDSTNGMIDLGTLESPCPLCFDYSHANGINDAGQVVGSSSTTSGEVHAFLWDSNTGMRDLGTLGGARSGAGAINNVGQIVGNSFSFDGERHAFIWDSSTGMRDLGTLGGNISEAYAINDHDQVVGHSYTIDNDYDSIRPFIWDSNNGMVRLDELLSADSGWTELRPQAINNWGQIVGYGITEAGQVHAFLMTPIPPKVIYVDDDAVGANDGSSWADGYNYLQDALAAASSGDEIRVAQGSYKPDQGAGITPGDKTATFQLKNGVALAGGYAGAGNPDPNERDVQSYETVLNGHGFIDHVVTGSGTDASAILDGVTVQGGQADGSYPEGQGAGMLNKNGSPTVIECTFKGNWANRLGGAMYNRQGSNPMVIDCRFEDNTAYEFSGGAIHSSNASSPVIRGCKFINNRCGLKSQNYTSQGGAICNKDGDVIILNCEFVDNQAGREGAAIYIDGGKPVVSHCMFYGNSCTRDGGAIYIYGRGLTLNISHCVFTNNNAARNGGAVFVGYSASVDLTNCSFYKNQACFYGGALLISGSGGPASRISNCIFWQNQDVTGMTESAQVYSPVSLPIENSVLQGLQVYKGAGNIDLDPRFMDADGVDNQLGTADDNLRLLPDSPCVNAGSNSAVPPDELDLDNDGDLTEPIPIDLDGDPRFADSAAAPLSLLPTVDMGPYENPKQGFVLLPDRIEVPEAGTAVFSVALSCDPASSVQVHVKVESGDEDITIQKGQILHFTSDDYWIPKPVTVAAEDDSDRFTGKADILVSAQGIRPGGVLALEGENESYADIILVDDDATGVKDGSSWHDAFTSLQDALDEVYGTVSDDDAAVADQAESTIKQIWVAQDIYRPTEGSNRRISFLLGNGLVIKGGYAGCTEPNPDERDIQKYETILSGDLMGNDTPGLSPENLLTDSSRMDNSWTVILASGVNRSAVLDGCTIYGGQADSKYTDEPTGNGGGIYMEWGNPTLKNCTFRANAAARSGGGILNRFGLPLLLNCCFEGNYCDWSGGGLCNLWGSPTLHVCSFEDNYAGTGAGLYNLTSSVLTLDRCTFNSNVTTYRGGGIMLYEYGGRTILNNCLLTGNQALEGGAIGCDAEVSGDLILNNCTVAENEAENTAGGIFSRYGGSAISNCIFWANADSTGYTETAQINVPYPAVNYTCVQGWTGQWPGVGNIGSDPYFVASHNGDYHLKSQSGRWDPISQTWVQDDVTGSCIDAGDPMSPIGPEPFPNGGIINMGAYGGTTEASKSYFGKPPCETIVAGDINGDCEVNFLDFRLMALHWCEDNNP